MTPCLQCLNFVESHEGFVEGSDGGVCPGRPKDAVEYAERELRRRAPRLHEVVELALFFFPKLRR